LRSTRIFSQKRRYENEIKDEKLDELRPEYDLGTLLQKGVRGKYARCYERGTNLILLSPDVARDFPTDESVKEALRLVMKLKRIPGGSKRRAAGMQ
jgi:hypothetical protein